MRSLGLIAPVVLAACAAQAQPQEAPPKVFGVTPGHKCVATDVSSLIGQPKSSETEAAVLKATNAAVLRWAPPGVMLSMIFREDRATVHLDADGKITGINCG